MATLSQSESRRLYSWWWDSHISPKNSKWLQENLKDMDAKVKAMIKLIEEDADSFAKRAEMYYKKRPELMKLIEEIYRAYRALAERYDYATGELRQAHRTMAEAFPNHVPFLLADDSPSASRTSPHGKEPHTQETPYPMQALVDPDDLSRELGLSATDIEATKTLGPAFGQSEGRISGKGLKQLHDMLLGAGELAAQNSKLVEERLSKGLNHEAEERRRSMHELSQLSNENQNLKAKVLSESERAGKAETEIQRLKEALADMQAMKEAALLQYELLLEKLSKLEAELSNAREDSMGLMEKASKAEAEVQALNEACNKIEAERDAALTKYKDCVERISNLEGILSDAREDVIKLNKQASKAENEAESLKDEIFRLESEKEARLNQYNLCLRKIADLENKVCIAEEDAKMLNARADKAETEVKKLKREITDLNDEKEASASKYRHCLDKISKLENEIYCAQEDVKRLNNEILIGSSKLKNAEEKCLLLEMSNQSLHLEADNLAKKIALKDRELFEKQEELNKVHILLQDESSHYAQIEGALNTLQNMHSQSQEEQRALALELKNGLQMLKDLESSKHELQDEIRRIKDENHSLNELKSSSTVSIGNLQNEISRLREMKEKLEDKVLQQMGQSNSLQQEISCLKEEIKGLNSSYQGLIQEVESTGLSPECIGSSVKSLQDENSRLRLICENHNNEKDKLTLKLKNMEELLSKKSDLESSLLEVNNELKGSTEKAKALQESCELLRGEKSVLVAEKASLLSQLQILTENMQKLLEKNAVVEHSLFGAKIELEGLREKSKGLEDICQLLKNEKSDLLAERGSLVAQLRNIERRLECLEKKFTGLEEKCADLEKQKDVGHSEMAELKVSLSKEKEQRLNLKLQCDNRLASLEDRIHLLQEENMSRKKEFEEELDKAVKSQFEIFVLQKFIKDMEEKNYSLLIECQKHVEASKLAEKLISELESENLEQEVEAELLLNEIERLRLWIYQVYKAFESGTNGASDNKIENEQIFVHRILGNIEDMKCTLSKYQDDEQQLLVENSVLLTLVKQLKFDSEEIESQKKLLEQQCKQIAEKLMMAQSDKSELLEQNKKLKSNISKVDCKANMLDTEVRTLRANQCDMQQNYLKLQEAYSEALEQNRFLLRRFSDLKEEKCIMEQDNDAILLETLTLLNLSTIFKSLGTEKGWEVRLLSDDLQNLREVNNNLNDDVSTLRGKLEMKEAENLLLKDSIQRLEMELQREIESNFHLRQEVLAGNETLRQRESALLRAEEKLDATELLNSELCKTMDALRRESQQSTHLIENLEEKVLKLSENSSIQNKEIECLHQVNTDLVSELGKLHEEIQEQKTREENLSLEMLERSNECELWEAEAAAFYFDLQISSIHEVLYENKVHELTGACESLQQEGASKTLEIKWMKEKINLMECEIGELRSQLFAYAPVIASLENDVASLEQNTKLYIADVPGPECAEVIVHPDEHSCEQQREDQTPLPNGVQDLKKLQVRLKAVEKLVTEDANIAVSQDRLKVKIRREVNEIEELKAQRSLNLKSGKIKDRRGHSDELTGKPKLQKPELDALEIRKRNLMKDIPLDQGTDGSVRGSSRRGSRGSDRADDQMLELWETVENCCLNRAGDAQFVHGDRKIEHPSSELEMEKELGIDKLEVSVSVSQQNREVNSRRILERLTSDAKKLEDLQLTVQNLGEKLKANKKRRKPKDVDIETVEEQLEEVEETVLQLLDLNSQLTKNMEGSPSASSRKTAEFRDVLNIRRKKVCDQARKCSEKIGRLQLEVQKIQYILLQLEEEKKSRSRSKFSKSISLRSFIFMGRRNSGRQKKKPHCGCFRSGGNGSPSYV